MDRVAAPEFTPDADLLVCRECGAKWDRWHEKRRGRVHWSRMRWFR